jgi:thiamine pyrophosphate-dependent acetolactate synthase large subunit-like protein
MHLVAAIDRVKGTRGVLGLFEGGVTGAADGSARMTGSPAATLLHLGPGMANEARQYPQRQTRPRHRLGKFGLLVIG